MDEGGQRNGWFERLRSNTFLRHVLTLMTGTAMAQLITLAARPVLTRIYTPAEFGVYSIYLSVAGAFVTIGALRYDMAVLIPESDGEGRSVVRLATRIALVVSGVVTVGMVIFAGPIAGLLGKPAAAPYLPLVGLLVFPMTQLSSRQYWLNRRLRYKDIARNRMGQSVGTVSTQLAAGLAISGPTGLVLGSLVGQWISCVNLFRLTRDETRRQDGDPSLREVAVEHRKMPLVNGPTAVVDTVRLNGINLMTAAYFSERALGHFSQAWQLLQMPMGLINGALSQVFFKKLATTRRGQMLPVVRNAVVRSLAIGFVPFTLIWLLSPWLFPFVLGSEWHESGMVARALVPWLYLNFVTSPISNLFVTIRRQGTVFVFSLFYMAVPLWLIWHDHSSMLATMSAVSWAMAGLLCCFVVMALVVAWQYDHGHGMRADEASSQAAEIETVEADEAPLA